VDRAQVLFDATLVVDPAGVIRLFLLPDSAHFDPTFGGVRRELDRMLGAGPAPLPARVHAEEVPLLAPGDVVTLAAGARGQDAVVHFAVAPGYHIMSDRPTDPFQIPTHVHAEGPEGAAMGVANFPAATAIAFDGGGGGEVLSTFEGSFDVVVRGGASARSVVVRYQACTSSRCLPPFTRRIGVDP
jgi:hypothetical protein